MSSNVDFASGLSFTVGNVAIPRQTAAGSFYWVAEANAATESQLTIGQLTMSPNIGAAYQEYSTKLLLQSTPSVEALVQDDLYQIGLLGIDAAVFHGAGSDEPTGIAGTSGIGSVDASSLGWPGAVEFETDVATGTGLDGRDPLRRAKRGDQGGPFAVHGNEHGRDDRRPVRHLALEVGFLADAEDLVERHLEHTSSSRARHVLDAWDDLVPKFVKVIPRDYQRMLAAIARAEEQGLVDIVLSRQTIPMPNLTTGAIPEACDTSVRKC
jgi:hypothetical protein